MHFRFVRPWTGNLQKKWHRARVLLFQKYFPTADRAARRSLYYTACLHPIVPVTRVSPSRDFGKEWFSGRTLRGIKKKQKEAASIKVTVTAEAFSLLSGRHYFRIITWNFTRFIGSLFHIIAVFKNRNQSFPRRARGALTVILSRLRRILPPAIACLPLSVLLVASADGNKADGMRRYAIQPSQPDRSLDLPTISLSRLGTPPSFILDESEAKMYIRRIAGDGNERTNLFVSRRLRFEGSASASSALCEQANGAGEMRETTVRLVRIPNRIRSVVRPSVRSCTCLLKSILEKAHPRNPHGRTHAHKQRQGSADAAKRAV